MDKPQHPYPPQVRRLLKKILPVALYRNYVGRHEDESMRLWKIMAAIVPPSEAILDVGAFDGDYALAARATNPLAAVYAFEPNPYSVQRLRSACDRNRITLIEAALADVDAELPFLCRWAESSILEGGTASVSNADVHIVRGLTLDRWAADDSILPSLIKIDVEGGEAGILRGGRHVLEKSRPVILCEVLSDDAGAEVMKALPIHYRFYHIDEQHGTDEERFITRRRWRNKNWLLVPDHRHPGFLAHTRAAAMRVRSRESTARG